MSETTKENKIINKCKIIEVTQEQINRIKDLFHFTTIDEGRSADNLFIEIGGPRVHAKIHSLTRLEVNVLHEAFKLILNKRLKAANDELIELCKEKVKESSI